MNKWKNIHSQKRNETTAKQTKLTKFTSTLSYSALLLTVSYSIFFTVYISKKRLCPNSC